MEHMRRVAPQPEPQNFDLAVRQRGQRWLASHPIGRPPNYWGKENLTTLFNSYNGICAFLSFRLERVNASVEHFYPIASHRHLAYEWTNYRLTHRIVNGYKGDSLDVLDPFTIENTWFCFNPLTGEVEASAGLDTVIREQVEATIRILQLNNQQFCEFRLYVLSECGDDMVTLALESPFLHAEVLRQNTIL